MVNATALPARHTQCEEEPQCTALGELIYVSQWAQQLTRLCACVVSVCAVVAAPGGSWQGKKVTFGDEDAEAAEGAAAQEQQGSPAAAPAAEPTAQKKKSSKGSKADGAASSDGGGSSSSKKKVKWGALAVQQLQQVPGGVLKWKKLWPLLLQAAEEQQRQQKKQGLKLKAAVDSSSKDVAWQKLQSCSKLQIDGKVVTLAA